MRLLILVALLLSGCSMKESLNEESGCHAEFTYKLDCQCECSDTDAEGFREVDLDGVN